MDAFLRKAGGQLLTHADQQRVLGLLADTRTALDEAEASKLNGVHLVRRARPGPQGGIYQVSGLGQLAASAQSTFDLLCSVDLMQEWDMLFKSGRYLNYTCDPSGAVCVAHLHVVYGLPGISRFISDRDFVIRCVRVSFPNGVHVLSCTSLDADDETDGDPGPMPGMIRGHMWHSGYVVLPARSEGCCVINITLQVDPRGWIPISVVNFALEATALNINRIGAALRRLPSGLLEGLPKMNMQAAMAGRYTVLQPSTARWQKADAGAEAAQAGAGVARQVVEAGRIAVW